MSILEEQISRELEINKLRTELMNTLKATKLEEEVKELEPPTIEEIKQQVIEW